MELPRLRSPVLAFFAVLSQRAGARLRDLQRSTCLGHTWRSTNWTYRFFEGGAREAHEKGGWLRDTREMGDVVRLLGVSNSYGQLVYKVIAMTQWVARELPSQFVIKLDTTTRMCTSTCW